MNSQEALVPQYMQNFQCIGSDCEDSCCIGWKVTIDKRTYKNLTSVTNRGMRETFKNGMQKLESNEATVQSFAVMKMDMGTGCCSMLNEEKLCSIQSALGEQYLSPICATYPRVVNTVNSEQEISAVMSCPEAARLALLNPEKMEFTYTKPLLLNNVLMKTKINPSAQSESYMELFWPIRIFIIEALQNRDFNIAHRLIIVGLFCEELQKLVDNDLDKEVNITELIEKYRNLIKNNDELRSFDTFPSDTEFQFITLNNIISKNLQNVGGNQRFKDVIENYVEGLTKESDDDALVDKYNNAYSKYYKAFMDKHEYIFENYLVNYVFTHLYPNSGSKLVFKGYMLMVSHFVLLKLLLIGNGAKCEGLSEELVIKVIQSFTRVSEHSNIFVKNTLEYLNEENYETMGHMSLLIKN